MSEKYTCPMCGKTYEVADVEWHDIVNINNENEITGSICEHCFENEFDEDIFCTTGSVPADAFDSDNVEVIRHEFNKSIEKKVRQCLDNIYKGCDTLAENFGEEICKEVTKTLIGNNSAGFTSKDINKKLVEETMLWLLQCKMQ